MGMIQNDWLEPLKPEFSKPYYKNLYEKVKEEYSTTGLSACGRHFQCF